MKQVVIPVMLVLLSVGIARADLWSEAQKLVTDGPSLSPPPPEPAEPPPSPASEPAAPGEDDHYIQQDDFFISEQPLGTHEWIYVQLSKMVTPPSSKTKGEGEFFKVTDGNRQWTRNFWKSRIAQAGELRLGTVAIIFEGALRDGVYFAPDAKDNARSGSWFMAKVTDMSDLYKGYLTVSGGYKVSPKNMRVIVK